MYIEIEENKSLNHNYIKIVIHPKNRYIAEKILKSHSYSLENIKVYDDENNMYFIPVLSILYIEIIDHHLYVYTMNEVYRLHHYSLKKFINQKKLIDFCQINAQTIVNINYILSYQTDNDCRRKVILKNGEYLIVNRSYKDHFERTMKTRKNEVL